MKSYDRGSAVLIEIEYKRTVPFGAEEYFDPTTPKITIYNPDGSERTANADLIKSSVGKFYYVCQTATNWAIGIYSGKTTGIDGTYSDVTKGEDLFSLK